MRPLLLSSVFIVLNSCFSCLSAQFTGIGTTAPQSRLHVNGTAWFQGDNTALSASAGAGIGIGFPPGGSGGYIFSFDYPSFTARDLWLQHPGGNVVIGSTTSAPPGKLTVLGESKRGLYVSSTNSEGIYAYSASTFGISVVSGSSFGLKATSQAAISAGIISDSKYCGVQASNTGTNTDRQAVRGENSNSAGGYAGLFNGGTTWVAGTLQKNAGAFLIDHPLEPETKFLYHSFVESPDMKNIYDGMVTTDAGGLAVVTMPKWFEALNMDFRYQLTCVGQFAQAIVLQEIAANQFTVKTDKPNVKVSWQVTGTRHDPWANNNRIPLEKQKRPDEVGKFIYPQGYGRDRNYLLDILKAPQFNETAVPSNSQ